MQGEFTTWDDGAARPLTVPLLTGVTTTLENGPLVFLGWSLTNAGAGSVKVTFNDGNGQNVGGAQIASGATNNTVLPDRGVKVKTELQVVVGAGGSIQGCLYVRNQTDVPRDYDTWPNNPSSSRSPYPPEPIQPHP